MARSIKIICMVAVLALTGALAKPVSSSDCYAICKYKGASGDTYIGISDKDCGSACDEARKKCTDDNDSPCTKIKCTATNCD